MRIVVNDIAASSGGALTVLKDFYKCVVEKDKVNEWFFLLGEKHFDETDHVKIKVFEGEKKSWIKRLRFDLFRGKKYIESLNPDVVFSLQNTCVFGLKIPQVLYVHQPIPFQSIKKFSFFKKKERKLAIYQYFIGAMIKKSVRKAEKIIVQTEWMRKAVAEKSDVSENKIIKISPNVNDIVSFKDNRAFKSNCFFYPTSDTVYKNNDLIKQACDIINETECDYSVELTLTGPLDNDNIYCIGRLPYEEVLKRYNTSTLVFPSYIETFGYPLIEARTMETIVLAADTEFSRELLDGYENAYFFKYDDPNELSDLMRKVINGKIEKKNKKEDEVCEKTNTWKYVLEELKNYGSSFAAKTM